MKPAPLSIPVGASTLTITASPPQSDGRVRYSYSILMRDGQKYENNDLQSGVMGGSVQDGLQSLLSFLGAAAESYEYTMRGNKSDDADMFPQFVMEWSYLHSEELISAMCDLSTSDKE